MSDVVEQAIEMLSEQRDSYLLKSYRWNDKFLNIDELTHELENANKYVVYNLGKEYKVEFVYEYQRMCLVIKRKFLWFYKYYSNENEKFNLFTGRKSAKHISEEDDFKSFIKDLSNRMIWKKLKS